LVKKLLQQTGKPTSKKVLWCGAGFSWKFRTGGAQGRRPGENAQEGAGGRESEGCSRMPARGE